MNERQQSGRRASGKGSGSGGGPELAAYHEKRHFDRTHEPRGGESEAGARGAYVIQIHDASSMHFDFRLEVDGVLRSWAVPKGPSTDVQEKRLAMPTEDHPLEYREFEGVIPRGEYGAGTVIVWDEGTYEASEASRGKGEPSFGEALDHGHAAFRLHGAKLHGAYALTRFRGGGGEKEAWLLVKKKDAQAGNRSDVDPVRARSVRSGRTLRQVAEESENAWSGNGRGGTGSPPSRKADDG